VKITTNLKSNQIIFEKKIKIKSRSNQDQIKSFKKTKFILNKIKTCGINLCITEP